MTITQTVEIPANRRLVIDVPHEVPTGKTILAFTPVLAKELNTKDIELINLNAKQLNEEAMDVLLYQDIDSLEEELDKLSSKDKKVISGTAVPITSKDIVHRI